MKILNFGSLNIDHVYKVDHIARPGETVSGTGYVRNCGGKGLNQSVALARAGANVWHAGRVGQDGLFLLDMLAKDGVNVDLVEPDDGPTGHAVIQVDRSGENSIVLFGGANRAITKSQVKKTFKYCSQGDILLVQNEISLMPEIISLAAHKKMRVAFNPAPFGPEVLRYPLNLVDMFIVNETEGQGLTGKDNPQDIVCAMLRSYPRAAVVLTLGDKGVIYQDKESRFEIEAGKVIAKDTTAAGDTFIGYLLSHLSQGHNTAQCLGMACKAASLCVTRPGAAQSIPRFEECGR